MEGQDCGTNEESNIFLKELWFMKLKLEKIGLSKQFQINCSHLDTWRDTDWVSNTADKLLKQSMMVT